MAIRIGTCSWTDKTLLTCGRFYPPEVVKDAELRLKFYAQHFDTVEVDSSYYHMPSERNSVLWVERTPDSFTFNIKAYQKLTLHDRSSKPTKLEWKMFASALRPLYEAKKLGYVLFQFPPWFKRSEDNMRYMLECRDRLGDYRLAFQFRHGSWMWPPYREQTLAFMRENDLCYVAVDEPQFKSRSTIPPVAEATVAQLAVVRFNGRNARNWFKRGIPVYERFHYRYSTEELLDWVPKIKRLAEQAETVFVMFNNCYADDAIVNAKEIAQLLL